ncbi:MAG TPA: hypothetical protein VLA12_13470 [Planctomycetaceae bacterium]|nr:hypothetical protein [Planctomycetaceae bacterium]
MNQLQLQKWLTKKLATQQILLWLGAVASLLVGAIVLYLTFWMTYGLLWFTTSWFINLSHSTLMIVSGLILLFLFIANATTDRGYLDEIELNVGPHREIQLLVARASGMGWMMAFSDAKAARSTIKMISTLLFTGPRITVECVKLIQKASRMRKIEIENCSIVLLQAIKLGKRLTFESLLDDFSKESLPTLISDLSLIEGVVLLRSEPPGLTLAPHFVEELKNS